MPPQAAPTGDQFEPIRAALVGMGLLDADELPSMKPLPGGVSSDILLVERRDGGRICVKRALARLKVAADWRAPVERNHAEAEWLRAVAAILPGAVPQLLGEDRALGLFATPYLPPETYPVWKNLLRNGEASLKTAGQVGIALASIHAATAGDSAIAACFANDATFHAIRLEPYLIATGRAHADLADALGRLAARTAATRLALVHGDVSPKNILVGPEGPVFIDAECAWYGDPAFDAAFCLNHLLLKCLWRPGSAGEYLMVFEELAHTYLRHADWEDATALEGRIATLLPALMLARVDGKSPVEYLTEKSQKDAVRGFARRWIAAPTDRLELIRDAWARQVLP